MLFVTGEMTSNTCLVGWTRPFAEAKENWDQPAQMTSSLNFAPMLMLYEPLAAQKKKRETLLNNSCNKKDQLIGTKSCKTAFCESYMDWEKCRSIHISLYMRIEHLSKTGPKYSKPE